MGNRKQPFGYKMEFGEIVPQPQEAETIRSIYLQYLAGASFKQLTEQLQAEDVHYDVDKPWNKNMVARILEDDRYIGEKYFPALIPTEQFHAAQERRKEMRPEYKQTPAQKELRKLCGGIVPDSVARRVLKILNQVVDDPQLIKIESSGVPTTEDIRQRRLELDKLLQTPPVDEEIARQKAMELAVLTLVSVTSMISMPIWISWRARRQKRNLDRQHCSSMPLQAIVSRWCIRAVPILRSLQRLVMTHTPPSYFPLAVVPRSIFARIHRPRR